MGEIRISASVPIPDPVFDRASAIFIIQEEIQKMLRSWAEEAARLGAHGVVEPPSITWEGTEHGWLAKLTSQVQVRDPEPGPSS